MIMIQDCFIFLLCVLLLYFIFLIVKAYYDEWRWQKLCEKVFKDYEEQLWRWDKDDK